MFTKEKFTARIKLYFPSVENRDVREPLFLSHNTYMWSCSCGHDVSSEGKQEIWVNILEHLCTPKHHNGNREKIEYIEQKMDEINDKLSPETLDLLEPKIKKLRAHHRTIAKWSW